ncbi:MAG: DUF5103 domain-containing protein [Tannerella sp.]|jgi:hypothetical protein|nr:DUF5103 domain-containing protein [Tannerella sp.]
MMNKKTGFILTLHLLLAVNLLTAQTAYETKVYSGLVKSLRVEVVDELISEPFIELNGDQLLEVNFDVLSHVEGRYTYEIIHCNADWTKSMLSPIEYMDGFQRMPIEDFAQAFNTTTHYTNYRLFLPNENIRFKVSGNYVIQVFDEDDPGKMLLSARFAVYEPLIGIDATISSNTDISFNREHQQLSFQLNTQKIPVSFPQSELKVFVSNNNRTDNIVTDLQPSIIANNRLTYEHNRSLIFEAGNEYRRIEFLTHQYNGMNIAQIRYFNPYYHAEVIPDHSRAGQSYLYDQDQNGRFFVRCLNCQEPDTEADYYIVHFTYVSPPIQGVNIYMIGNMYQNILDENSRMNYNSERGQYEKDLLLKQGHYNYQYLMVPNGETKGQLADTEGNFFQTENEYTITVFHRPFGGRYDRLIGKTTVRNPQNIL